MTKKAALPRDVANQSPESRLAEKIRSGECVSDTEFDQLYSDRLRTLSSVHWTPVNVAVRAAKLATEQGQKRILDIGLGTGKFCTIGALISQANFVGVEQREYLVEAANDIADRFNLMNVRFIHMNAIDLDWTEFDSFYIFNPYSENLDQEIHIDHLCEFSVELYCKYVTHTQWKLSETRSGTTVVLYNRFGGDLPPTFECLHKEEIDFMPLEVWRKR